MISSSDWDPAGSDCFSLFLLFSTVHFVSRHAAWFVCEWQIQWKLRHVWGKKNDEIVLLSKVLLVIWRSQSDLKKKKRQTLLNCHFTGRVWGNASANVHSYKVLAPTGCVTCALCIYMSVCVCASLSTSVYILSARVRHWFACYVIATRHQWVYLCVQWVRQRESEREKI